MDKLLLRPEEVAELIGVGRTKVFELMRTGQLESVRIGACRRIPASAVFAYVEGLRATSGEFPDTSATSRPEDRPFLVDT
jgi:excisionase family DNA binding protein